MIRCKFCFERIIGKCLFVTFKTKKSEKRKKAYTFLTIKSGNLGLTRLILVLFRIKRQLTKGTVAIHLYLSLINDLLDLIQYPIRSDADNYTLHCSILH